MGRVLVLSLESLFILFLFSLLVVNFSNLALVQVRNQLFLQPVSSSPSQSIVLTGSENGHSTPDLVAVNTSDEPKDYQPPLPIEVQKVVNDIFNPTAVNATSELGCQDLITDRYTHLKSLPTSQSKPKYFFAINLHQNRDNLPAFLSTLLRTVTFLSPSSTFLSFVSHSSTDGTAEIISALTPSLNALNISHSIVHTHGSPSSSALHNVALSPLTSRPESFTRDLIHGEETTIIFLDGTPLCLDDILELIHARCTNSADLMCGMDYIEGGRRYYNSLKEHFWIDDSARERFINKSPFQVRSCWSGALVVARAAPFLEHGVQFRAQGEGPGNCGKYAEEAVRLAVEFGESGFGRVGIVPSVSLSAGVAGGDGGGIKGLKETARVKRARGLTIENVGGKEKGKRKEGDGRIEWRKDLLGWAMCGAGDEHKDVYDHRKVWNNGPVVPLAGC